MSGAVRTPFRVLLYAHVDLNVVDGSAFFVAGAASLLTSVPGVTVDVVSATPLRRAVVMHEVLGNPRVTVTDPYADEGLVLRRPQLAGLNRMDEATAASMLEHYVEHGRHDVVIIRSTEVAEALARLRPDLGARLCVYVTGVVAADVPIEATTQGLLRRLVDGGATLLCQTPEMRDHLAAWLDEVGASGALAVMRPSVPAGPGAVPVGAAGPLVLAYTGKFAPAWNTVETLAGFKEAASSVDGLRLVVAGDHFKRTPEWPTFAQEVRYLLGSHPDIRWVGAVTRDEARALVLAADVGLSWRGPVLDQSLELSTKVLEHGSLGRPTVINPTAMHRRLFGADYPLFAASMPEFVALLRRMTLDRGLVAEAAARATAVAADYTYDRVMRQLFPALITAAAAGAPGTRLAGFAAGVQRLLASGARSVEHDGWVVAWLADGDDGADLLAHASDGTVVAQALGPFVRWPTQRHAEAPDDGVTLLRLVVDVLAEQRAPGAAGRAMEGGPAGAPSTPDGVIHDRSGRVTAAPAGAATSAEKGAVAPVAGTAADSAPATLAADLARQSAEVARLRRRYEALAASRLGRAQLGYWRLRSRLRRRRRPGD